MRTALVMLSLACLALPAAAQLTVIPNTGCTDGSPVGGSIYAVSNQDPKIGTQTFGLAHTCPFGSTAAFVVWGTCNTGPLVDWDLTAPCFSAWTSAPASCAQVYGQLYPLSGGLTRQDKFVWPFPIPNIPQLVTLTQATPLCIQFICADLDANPDLCLSVSAGVQLIFMPC